MDTGGSAALDRDLNLEGLAAAHHGRGEDTPHPDFIVRAAGLKRHTQDFHAQGTGRHARGAGVARVLSSVAQQYHPALVLGVEGAHRHLQRAADVGAAGRHVHRQVAYRRQVGGEGEFRGRVRPEHHQAHAGLGRLALDGAVDEIERVRHGVRLDAARHVEGEHHVGVPRGAALERSREGHDERGDRERAKSGAGDAPEAHLLSPESASAPCQQRQQREER